MLPHHKDDKHEDLGLFDDYVYVGRWRINPCLLSQGVCATLLVIFMMKGFAFRAASSALRDVLLLTRCVFAQLLDCCEVAIEHADLATFLVHRFIPHRHRSRRKGK